ncbi:tetratricopeptide repeat protein [Undibacterium arcticum]
MREIRELNRIAWDSQHTDPAQSIALATRCIARAQLASDPSGLAYALLNKAYHEYYFSTKEQSEQTLIDTEARFRALGDRRGLLLARSGLGGILMRRHEFDAARSVLESVINDPPEASEPLDAYYALYRLGYLHFNCGDVQAGLRYYYKALALVQRERSLPLTCQMLSDIGSAQMELGNFTEAKALLEQAFVISRTTPVFFIHMILGNLANVHLEMGNADAALRLLESNAIESGPFYREGDRAFLMAVKAQTYASLSRWDEAESQAHAALDQARQDDYAEVNSHCLWQLGAIACGKGQFDVGIGWLLEAEASFGAEQNIFYVLHVYKALADAYASSAQYQTAFNYLKRYHQQYEKSLGASAKAQFFTLQIQHELTQVQFERDYALQQQINLETLNNELRHKVTEIESLQTALREQAMRDPLTGLYNRRILGEQLGTLLNLARRSDFCGQSRAARHGPFQADQRHARTRCR